MVDSLYYSSRKISERCENSFAELQNILPKALLFNEANHERFELTHCIDGRVQKTLGDVVINEYG